MGEIDISGIAAGELRSLKGARESLGISKGRLAQLIANGKIDYGTVDGMKLIPVSEIERRKRENPGPGNPNFKSGRGKAQASAEPVRE